MKRVHPCLPVPEGNVRVIELAGLWSLIDCRAGKPRDEWWPELQAQATMMRELVFAGIGDADITVLADRALEVLATDPVEDMQVLQALVSTLPMQVRSCNWRQFSQAQDRALAAVATTPLAEVR